MKTTKLCRGITLVEMLVLLTVLAVLVSLTFPFIDSLAKGQQMSVLSNAKQIHLATFNMIQDRISTNNKSIGWPGDLVASGTMPCTVTDFVKVLVKGDYLKLSDLKVFSAPGITPFTGTSINQFCAKPGSKNNCAFTIYCVQESDPANAIFISTLNATLDVSNTTFSLNPKAVPYGEAGFVLIHKGGDGAKYKKSETTPAHSDRIEIPCKMALSGTAALEAR